MRLSIKNVGKLKEAEVEINGITVITGENDTGKSTVGKVLWSVFNGFYKIDEQIAMEKQESIEEIIFNNFLDSMYQYNTGYLDPFYNEKEERENIKNISKEIVKDFETLKNDDIKLKKYLSELLYKIIYPGASDYKIDEVTKVLQLPNERIRKIAINKRLLKEFNNQINNIYLEAEAEMELIIKDKSLKIIVENNKIKDLKEEMYLNTEVFYIDDPHILDELEEISLEKIKFSHREHLMERLLKQEELSVINELLAEDRWEKINEKLNDIVKGKLIRKQNKQGFFYRNAQDNSAELDIKNLSMGLKVFTIIKLLIQNNALKENGTIILDEPEIHLHPEWQLKFAELIVLLQKEFGMHILLTTHSPYFVNAIEVFSEKYGIDKKCKYYVAENVENSSIIKNVTDNTREIYRKLARPIQDLENIRYSDFNG